jgi:hypothetical protein
MDLSGRRQVLAWMVFQGNYAVFTITAINFDIERREVPLAGLPRRAVSALLLRTGWCAD